MSSNGEMPDTAGMHGSDRYTMAEAARIKGVSYHTVSRAVRSGKLPAQRLGRMALIAAADLQAWRPMRERAPRKYRREEPRGQAAPPPPALSGTTVVNASYASRLMVAMEQLAEVASAESTAAFGDWLAQWLATSLGQEAAVIWRFGEDSAFARLYGSRGVDRGAVPSQLREGGFEVLRDLAGRRQAVPLDRAALARVGAARWLPGTTRALLVPLQVGSDSLGCALVLGTARDRQLTEEDRAFAERLCSRAAFAARHVDLREAERSRFLGSTSAFDNLPMQLSAVDRQGTVVYVNRGFTDFWGEEARARVTGRHYTRFIRDFRRETMDGVEVRIEDHPLTRALRGEVVPETRHLLPDAAGGPKVFALSAWPAWDESSAQTGAVFCAREVTDEFEATGDPARSPVAMLAAARRRVELLAELSNEIAQRRESDDIFSIIASRACAVLDADYATVLTPDASGDLLMRAAHNLATGARIGRSVNRLTFPSVILAMAERDLIYVNEEDAGPGGRQILQAGGGRVALLIPLVDNDQALGILAVHYRDAERLRQVDPELARAVGRQCGHAVHLRNVVIELEASRRRLLTTLDQLPQVVVIVDAPDGHIVAMNREAQAIWGEGPERLGQHVTDIELLDEDGSPIPPERHPFLRPLRTHRTEFGVPLIVRDRGGALIDVVANLAPVMGRSGELRGAVAVLHRREHFRPIDQAKDEFISVVAHELRNPLTSLRGNLQLLARRLNKLDTPGLERERERVGGVIEQVDRIGDLVSRMLDVSRADLGKLTIDPGEADASAIARAAVADVSGQLDQRRIHVDAPEHLPVTWDRVRVQQILVNLLTNAVRHAPSGDIELTVREEGDEIAVAVRDHGPGVPPKLRRRLFRLYYRFDDGEETADGLAAQQRGLGIGLYISARLAKAHGGKLAVADAPGGGAVFTLRLPRDVAPAQTTI